MSGVHYHDADVAEEFEATRYWSAEVLEIWCDRMTPWFEVGPGQRRVLDLGAGTGIWSLAIAERFGIPVVGVEPAAGMRTMAAGKAPHPLVDFVAGAAEALPLRDESVTAAWLSTVIHHLDLPVALPELRRVLVPGAPVIVRTFVPERHPDSELFHHFPAIRLASEHWVGRDGDTLTAVFADAGFHSQAIETVDEPYAESYDDVLCMLPQTRHSDSAFVNLSDEDWEAGVASVRRARDEGRTPQPMVFDLVVFT